MNFMTMSNNVSLFLSDNSGSTWDGVPLWYNKEPIVPVLSIFLEIKTLKISNLPSNSNGLHLELKLDDQLAFISRKTY